MYITDEANNNVSQAEIFYGGSIFLYIIKIVKIGKWFNSKNWKIALQDAKNILV